MSKLFKKHDAKIPTIGIILNVGYLGQSYNTNLWPGLIDGAERNNVNIVMFVGRSPISAVGFRFRQDISGKFIDPGKIDALILNAGMMNDYLSYQDIIKYCRQYKPIPVVNVALKVENTPSILVDNNSGIHHSVEHLVLTHGFRRIAFVTGPPDNYESNERLAAFKKACDLFNIKIDERLIVPGYFSKESGREAVKILLKRKKRAFDAIIAADDETALGVIQELKLHGLSVPYDVAVVGFDDIEEASSLTPALTTIKQPYYEQGYKAVQIAASIARKQDVEKTVILPTRLVIRQSCGCFPGSITRIKLFEKGTFKDPPGITKLLDEHHDEIIGELMLKTRHVKENYNAMFYLSEIYTIFAEYMNNEDADNSFLTKIASIFTQIANNDFDLQRWEYLLSEMKYQIEKTIRLNEPNARIEMFFQKITIMIEEIVLQTRANEKALREQRVWILQDISKMLISTFDLKELKNLICKNFPRLNIKSCYIAFFHHEEEDVYDYSDLSKLILAYNEAHGRLDTQAIEPKIFPTRNLLPSGLIPEDRRQSFIFMALYFKKQKFGYILYEIGPKDEMIYETLRGQIGSAIEGAILVKELEKNNRQLHFLSVNDELTGLLNRRGFLVEAEKYIQQALEVQGEFLLFFIDLDGLKYINDTYGHREGDFALTVTADILKDTFHQDDIIARLSGDEFAVIAQDAQDKYAETLKKRFFDKLNEYNQNIGKPYKIAISIGKTVFNPNKFTDLETLMENADKDLYKQKKNRKSWFGN